MESTYHTPVMLAEVITALQIIPSGVYVDCTLGGGGHATAMLNQLGSQGRLVVFDQDVDAKQNVPEDARVIFVHQNFRHIQKMLRLHGITQVNGLLADLGVSSHQFDAAERGFSTRFNAMLDMRMDSRNSTTAAHIVNTYTQLQLHKVMEQYGEVTNAKTLATAIVTARTLQPITTIEGFKNVLVPFTKGNPNKYYAQVFQALRIAVNEELQALQELLAQLPTILAPQARVAIITFHSLEDRLVKLFFKKGNFNDDNQIDENPFSTITTNAPLKNLTKKPIEATAEELKKNPRSRSAKLRIATTN